MKVIAIDNQEALDSHNPLDMATDGSNDQVKESDPVKTLAC